MRTFFFMCVYGFPLVRRPYLYYIDLCRPPSNLCQFPVPVPSKVICCFCLFQMCKRFLLFLIVLNFIFNFSLFQCFPVSACFSLLQLGSVSVCFSCTCFAFLFQLITCCINVSSNFSLLQFQFRFPCLSVCFGFSKKRHGATRHDMT